MTPTETIKQFLDECSETILVDNLWTNQSKKLIALCRELLTCVDDGCYAETLSRAAEIVGVTEAS